MRVPVHGFQKRFLDAAILPFSHYVFEVSCVFNIYGPTSILGRLRQAASDLRAELSRPICCSRTLISVLLQFENKLVALISSYCSIKNAYVITVLITLKFHMDEHRDLGKSFTQKEQCDRPNQHRYMLLLSRFSI